MAKESKAERLATVETFSTQVLRRKVRIGFSVGDTREALLEKLMLVPEFAKVDEVVDDLDGDGVTTIEFHHESSIL